MTHGLALVLALVSTQAAAPPGVASPAPESTPASPVSVTATASKGEVTLGEAFTLELKATGPAGATYTFAGEASTDTLELRTPTAPAGAAAAPTAEPGTHRCCLRHINAAIERNVGSGP